MIQANELRIGNYVRCVEGNIIKINKEDFICILTNTYEVDPIPLTEEILLKCGFERKSYTTKGVEIEVIYYKIGNIVVYLMRDFFEIEITTSSGQFNLHKTFPKKLHQLQNLYFALTGEELEVKL